MSAHGANPGNKTRTIFFFFNGNGGLIYKITSSYITNSGPLGTYSVRPKACHIPYKTYINKTGTGARSEERRVGKEC